MDWMSPTGRSFAEVQIGSSEDVATGAAATAGEEGAGGRGQRREASLVWIGR